MPHKERHLFFLPQENRQYRFREEGFYGQAA
jgi:hypothetical protein